MGNNQSQQSVKKNNLFEVVNNIATNYILTQNFKDMIDLNNPEVCNNLVIITSQIIKKSLNWRTILYLDQHLQGRYSKRRHLLQVQYRIIWDLILPPFYSGFHWCIRPIYLQELLS